MDKEAHRIKVIAENERLLISNIELRRDRDTLRAENERLREALARLGKIGDKVPVDIGLVALIAKEALK